MEELKNNIETLNNLKQEYYNKIKLIEKEIENIKNKIYETCVSENGEHKWIMEIEKGMYGETYYFCERCNISY